MNTSASTPGAATHSPERGYDRHGRVVIKRHSLVTMTWHWLNFACLTILLMSGLQIFNAHPNLYWGDASDFETPFIAIDAMRGPDGRAMGVTRIAGHTFETTGVLGLSRHDGEREIRAFPHWMTLPGSRWLAMARSWHFFFAWIFGSTLLLYLLYSLSTGHLRDKMWPRLAEWRQFGRTVWEHMRLRFPTGEEARHYNILQKLTYLLVLFGLLPLMVLSGLTMSPTMNAAWPWLLDLFGGRQSARTVHFLTAFGLLAFFFIHIALVLLSGVINNMRSMITGRYSLPPDPDDNTGEQNHG